MELDTSIIYRKKVPVYQDDKIVKYITGNLSCLIQNDKILTNYYNEIKYLKKDDYYKVAYCVLKDNKVIIRYKVIELQRDENNKIIPFHERIIINDLYRYVYYAGEHTLTLEKDGFYSYIELNPLLFTTIVSFYLYESKLFWFRIPLLC